MKAVDIPQADSLSRVRELVQSVKFGATDVARLQKVMTLHPRHVGYHLHAARILNWMVKEKDEWSLTQTGAALLTTVAGSQEERSIFRQSIEASDFLKVVAPNLFADEEPAQDLLSVRIQEVAQIAPATARRRASTLLRWRTQSLPVKARLASFQFDEQDDEDGTAASIELHSVEVSNFGLLRSIRVEMLQSVVLTGQHSTGKSTFFNGLALIKACLESSISEAIASQATNWRDLLWFGEGDRFAFAIEFRLPKSARYDLSRARYEVEIGADEDGSVGLLRESFFLRPRDIEPAEVIQQSSPKGWRKVFGTNQEGQTRFGSEHPSSRKSTSSGGGRDTLGFASLPQDGERFPAALRVRNFLVNKLIFVDLNPNLMLTESSDGSHDMDREGRGFLNMLSSLSESNQEHFEEWQAHVLEAIPKVQGFELVNADGSISLLATMRGGFKINAKYLSNGELRLMGLALLSYQYSDGGLLCIESPEQGLHPTVIEAVSQALNRGGRVQVMVTTHSPNWVGVTPLERIRIFQPEAGGVRIMVGPQLDLLEHMDDSLGLPVVFAAGMLN